MTSFLRTAPRSILRLTLISTTLITTMTITACGGAGFSPAGSKKSARSGDERLSGDQLKDDCLALGNPTTPGQYEPGPSEPLPGKPVPPPTPPPGKGEEPYYDDDEIVVKKPCTANPGQNPGQNPPTGPCNGKGCDGDDDYVPPLTPGTEPKPFPGQQPYDPSTCGKNGKFCDNGGPGQYPGQTVTGGDYDPKDVEACFAAFRNQGYDTKGQWGIDVREITNVSVLSRSVIADHGKEPRLVIIKSVSVLGGLRYELLNPNALYCVKNVSVLERVTVQSCLTSNVVFGRDVNVLSRVRTETVDCQY